MLYQNDDFGKDYLIGLREGLGDKADKMIVATKTYETTDATVDSQIVALQGSGADVLLTAAIPKFAAQAIRKVYDIGWKPTHFLSNVAISVEAVMQPAGPEKGIGIISAGLLQGADRSAVAGHARIQGMAGLDEEIQFLGQHDRRQQRLRLLGRANDGPRAQGCGDNLTRENLMKQAASIHDLKLPMLLPGIIVSTSADDFAPIKQMQLQKLDGTTWQLFGEVISGSGS